MDKKKLLLIAGCVVVVAAIVLLIILAPSREAEGIDGIADGEAAEEVQILYGIDCTGMVLEEGTIQSGQTISTIFNKYGIGAATIDRTAKEAEPVFNLRNIRAGNNYTAFITDDSLATLKHFVYEQSITDFVIISYEGDSVSVRKESKDVMLERQVSSTTISSSLWNDMVAADMPLALIKDIEDIYQWTVDFFGLQKGDSLTLIYDHKLVDGHSVGVGNIWGAVFIHNKKTYYAIPYKQGEKVMYWDENGNSLRKSMLKAPLQYSRISSRFSNARLHPIYKVVRAHHGVDYAAPAGTPVVAVADGTIEFKGWDSGGGGNTLKLRHSSGLMTGYLHLQKFATGINVGTRVSQGDVIGYVGSTGASTGPHLDYRVWQNGKAIDPLKITAEPVEPISNQNRGEFDYVKKLTIAELQGILPDSLKITQLDTIRITAWEPPGEPGVIAAAQ